MNNYTVQRITGADGKRFIIKHHYSRGIHNGPMCWGLMSGGNLIGVCAFATPCSENVRASIFGKEYVQRVTELHRLAIIDDAPCNTESWFVSRAIKALKAEKPHIWAVVSFADETQGHVGTIYQAMNMLYYGRSGKATFYIDADGRLRHPRQNGVNITIEMARNRGWESVRREAKHRYLALLPDDRRHGRVLRSLLRVTPQPYPKISNVALLDQAARRGGDS